MDKNKSIRKSATNYKLIMEEIIFIGIIFIIILKFYKYINNVKKVENNEIKNPTLEYYEWKRLYFKMIVLNKFNDLYKNHKYKQKFKKYYKHKLRNSIISKSANF